MEEEEEEGRLGMGEAKGERAIEVGWDGKGRTMVRRLKGRWTLRVMSMYESLLFSFSRASAVDSKIGR